MLVQAKPVLVPGPALPAHRLATRGSLAFRQPERMRSPSPRGNLRRHRLSRTCGSSSGHQPVRCPGIRLLAEPTGELCPKALLKSHVFPAGPVEPLPGHWTRVDRPRTAGRNLRRPPARPPTSKRAVEAHPPSCIAPSGSEAGSRRPPGRTEKLCARRRLFSASMTMNRYCQSEPSSLKPEAIA